MTTTPTPPRISETLITAAYITGFLAPPIGLIAGLLITRRDPAGWSVVKWSLIFAALWALLYLFG